MHSQEGAGQRAADRTVQVRVHDDGHVAGKRQGAVQLFPGEFADQNQGQGERQGARFMLPPADRAGRERPVEDA